jgi:2-dehydro-3-deoxy-D-arabinonate dehydratase
MKLCYFLHPKGGSHIGLVENDQLYDLTTFDTERFHSIRNLFNEGLYRYLQTRHAEITTQESIPISSVRILPPIDTQEVWAAGVTYFRSREARMEESKEGGSFYDKVYDAPRPELFFKSTPHRTIGTNAAVKIRPDSRWNVPEPELALFISPHLRLVGYTIGNDMSSRDIEGENPLYLPQAKIYNASCALGPYILFAEAIADPRTLTIELVVERKDAVVFRGATSISKMKRSFAELIGYLSKSNSFPNGVFLLTGTGIIPEGNFTLQVGDVISITVPEIGTLRNSVEL